MAMRSGGQVSGALVLVALAVVAASGQGLAWAQVPRNETNTSANRETLAALMSTTSECVESIRTMKHGYLRTHPGSFPLTAISFPPDDTFIPPGAEAWCNCLQDNKPPGGVPSDRKGVFDTCRERVLVNSDYNAMDICRGMVALYGYDFFVYEDTFCSRRLCEDSIGNWRCYEDVGGPAYNLYQTCAFRCLQELSAGYCAKYRLTYGGWVRCSYDGVKRRIAVDGKYPDRRTQSNGLYDWGPTKIRTAQAMCDALYPTDQGRCCTYERGKATLSQCCYVKNGDLVFNCAKSYGGARLLYNCMVLAYSCDYSCYTTRRYRSCPVLIDYYVAHPSYQQAKLAELPGGQVSVVFPEAFMNDFCGSSEFARLEADGDRNYTPGTREHCCFRMNALFGKLVENCLPGAGNYPSLGATRLPLEVAPPPPSCDACSYPVSVGGSSTCRSVCKSDEECTVRNRAFCVRCDYFRQDFPDGKNRQCCELRDGDTGTLCRPKVTKQGRKNKCFTNEGPWTKNNGKKRNPQPYTIDAVQNVCNDRDNFRVNRKLCKVQVLNDGRKRCKYITDKQRDKILASR